MYINRSSPVDELPNCLNPYTTLSITPDTSVDQTKLKYMQFMQKPERKQRMLAALAYNMLSSKDQTKYRKLPNNEYKVIIKDHFYFASTGQTDNLKNLISNNKSLLQTTDEIGRSLLYLAARNGFFDTCKFLLKCGCDVNLKQSCGSTALHGATYYGHRQIVELLLEHGANIFIQNNYKHLPIQEAFSQDIRKIIESYNDDNILLLLNKLRLDNIADEVKSIFNYRKDKIIGKEIKLKNNKNVDTLSNNSVLTWHGTKYKFLESIAKYGLKPPGTVLPEGVLIEPQTGHIKRGISVNSIKDWAAAIFVSPSIFYAGDVVYAERIMSKNQRWACLIKIMLKIGSYTKYNHTLVKKENIPNEPDELEYRVEINKEITGDLIYRSNDSVILPVSIVFINVDFLENVGNYIEGEMVANSDKERHLFIDKN